MLQFVGSQRVGQDRATELKIHTNENLQIKDSQHQYMSVTGSQVITGKLRECLYQRKIIMSIILINSNMPNLRSVRNNFYA